jgi:hypothetical protein
MLKYSPENFLRNSQLKKISGSDTFSTSAETLKRGKGSTPKMAEKSSVKSANYMNDLISITNGPIP